MRGNQQVKSAQGVRRRRAGGAVIAQATHKEKPRAGQRRAPGENSGGRRSPPGGRPFIPDRGAANRPAQPTCRGRLGRAQLENTPWFRRNQTAPPSARPGGAIVLRRSTHASRSASFCPRASGCARGLLLRVPPSIKPSATACCSGGTRRRSPPRMPSRCLYHGCRRYHWSRSSGILSWLI